jgi:uncharacterized protein (TIGR02996 family)
MIESEAHELLARLRSRWRETRDPELAETYELLLREFQAPPLAGRNPAERAQSWLERAQRHAGDPRELPVLLAEPWTPEVDELERLRFLDAWSPDPLLATALHRRLRIAWVPAAMPTTREVRHRTLALFFKQRDPRFDQDVHTRPSLGPQSQEELERLAPRARLRRAHEARTAELLAAVHASPDRDEPRLVYADWLAAHGDPRGEFIVLQLQRARSGGEVTAREHELLERHEFEWAGDIHPALGLGARTFERGFLSAASVEVPNLEGEIVTAREWSTLRTLDGHVSDELARSGPFDHLRELYGYLQLEQFVALRADNRLAAVECYECSLADPNLPLDVPLGLKALLVRRALDPTLLALAESAAITGLEQLGVYYNSGPTAAADHRERRSVRHRFELLRGRLPSHVRSLRLLDDATARASRPCGWVLTFERDELEVFSQLRVDWWQPAHNRRGGESVTQLIEVLDELGLGGLRRLTLGSFEDAARGLAVERLEDLAKRFGIEASS